MDENRTMDMVDYEYSSSINTTIAYIFPTDEHVVPVVTYTAIGVLAAAENAICLIIVTSSKNFRRKRNTFLFSLSLADFIIDVLSVLIYFKDIYNPHLGSVLDAMFLVSMFSISAVCIERYVVLVAAPFNYKSIITFKRCVIACVLYWVITVCVISAVYAVVYNKWVRLAFCLVSIIALLANYILYYRISRALSKNDRDVTKNLNQNVIGRSQKLIWSFVILLVAASLCWLPLCIFFIIAVFSDEVDNNTFALSICYCISLSNSLINPFIYWYRLPGMKEGFYDLVCCTKKDDDHTPELTLPTSSTSSV